MKRVLVVDDAEIVLEPIKELLEKEKYNVDVCNQSEKAVKLAMQGNYDLILLDIMMPGMGGIEFLKTIKQQEKNKDTPVVMLSARDDMNSIRECLLSGAVDYMTKPINMENVKQRIAELIG